MTEKHISLPDKLKPNLHDCLQGQENSIMDSLMGKQVGHETDTSANGIFHYTTIGCPATNCNAICRISFHLTKGKVWKMGVPELKGCSKINDE